MSENVEFDEAEAKGFIDQAGLSASTIKARKLREKHFLSYVKKSVDEELVNSGEFWDQTEELEKLLIKYFGTLRVKTTKELPKRNTLDTARSHVRMLILGYTKNKVDISSKITFAQYEKYMSGLCTKVKRAGRGDTTSHEPLTDYEMERIFRVLGALSNLMELDNKDESYYENLHVLPEKFREDYHYLTMYGAMFIIIYYVSNLKCCRRIV